MKNLLETDVHKTLQENPQSWVIILRQKSGANHEPAKYEINLENNKNLYKINFLSQSGKSDQLLTKETALEKIQMIKKQNSNIIFEEYTRNSFQFNQFKIWQCQVCGAEIGLLGRVFDPLYKPFGLAHTHIPRQKF